MATFKNALGYFKSPEGKLELREKTKDLISEIKNKTNFLSEKGLAEILETVEENAILGTLLFDTKNFLNETIIKPEDETRTKEELVDFLVKRYFLLLSIDEDGKLSYVNENAINTFGKFKGESTLEGLNKDFKNGLYRPAYSESEQERVDNRLIKKLDNGLSYNAKTTLKDGTEIEWGSTGVENGSIRMGQNITNGFYVGNSGKKLDTLPLEQIQLANKEYMIDIANELLNNNIKNLILENKLTLDNYFIIEEYVKYLIDSSLLPINIRKDGKMYKKNAEYIHNVGNKNWDEAYDDTTKNLIENCKKLLEKYNFYTQEFDTKDSVSTYDYFRINLPQINGKSFDFGIGTDVKPENCEDDIEII